MDTNNVVNKGRGRVQPSNQSMQLEMISSSSSITSCVCVCVCISPSKANQSEMWTQALIRPHVVCTGSTKPLSCRGPVGLTSSVVESTQLHTSCYFIHLLSEGNIVFYWTDDKVIIYKMYKMFIVYYLNQCIDSTAAVTSKPSNKYKYVKINNKNYKNTVYIRSSYFLLCFYIGRGGKYIYCIFKYLHFSTLYLYFTAYCIRTKTTVRYSTCALIDFHLLPLHCILFTVGLLNSSETPSEGLGPSC